MGKLRPRELGKSLKATQLVELECKPEAVKPDPVPWSVLIGDWDTGHP